MKKLSLFAFALVASAFSTFTYAQSEAEMKAWMEFMTPGETHKMIASWDGTWEEDITMWMTPGGTGEKSKASVVNKMILGGRYQHSTHNGNFGGMPFEGISTLGYDNGKKKFVSSWVDNMGTGIMIMEGTWDAGKKAINFSGTQTDPTTGKDMKVREVFTVIDNNTQKMEMFMTTPDGKEYKSMEIVFKRK